MPKLFTELSVAETIELSGLIDMDDLQVLAQIEHEDSAELARKKAAEDAGQYLDADEDSVEYGFDVEVAAVANL